MFNAIRYIKTLEEAGFTRSQADAQLQIMTDIIESNLATKQDIKELEHKIVELEYKLVFKLSTIVGAMITLAIAVTAAVAKLI